MNPAIDGDYAVGCLFNCGRVRVRGSWGLCSSCHLKAQRMVESGQTTREQLVAEGKCLPPGRTNKQWGWGRRPKQTKGAST